MPLIRNIFHCKSKNRILFCLLFFIISSFSLSAQSPSTLTITSDDSDNIITTGQVTLTATFSVNMTASPTISISGVVTNVAMTQSTTAAVWIYYWQVPSNISSGTTVNVTATATDTNSSPYSGNASLTLTISPTFYLASNGVTIKCSGCSAGDYGMVSGTLYKAVDNNTSAGASFPSENSLTNEVRLWVSNQGGARYNYQLCTTLVTDMSSAFASKNVTGGGGLVFDNFDTSNVIDMGNMFSNASYPYNYDLTYWDTSNVTDMSYMFNNRTNTLINTWDTSKVTTMKAMFLNNDRFNDNISSWDVSSVTDMSRMFEYAARFNQPIGAWATKTASVTTMYRMFKDAEEFDQNIGAWDVSNVTTMEHMFWEQTRNVFNNGGSPDIRNWDTSKVTDMTFMFANNEKFNQPLGSGGGVTGWDVSGVVTFDSMFAGAEEFNQDIGSWDVSGGLSSAFARMFTGANDFNNGGSDSIKNWDVSGSSGSMDYMFLRTNMSHDLSTWCVPNITTATDFASLTPMAANSSSTYPKFGTCPTTATLVLTSDDSDNIISTGQVTLTATFSLSMSPTPTISIAGVVTNVAMTQTSTDTVWTYFWQVPGSITSETDLNVTATATDTNSRTYVGTESLTLTIDSFGPTLTFSDTDDDNLLAASDTVTITAVFSEAMTATPTILISGASISSAMTQISGTNSYTFNWDVSGSLNDGTYTATVSGADLQGNAYSGTDSITFTLDTTAPTVTLTDTDSDNLVSISQVVTITAGFSEAMTATPTISITGIVTNVIMTPVSGTNSYTFTWDTSSGTLSDGAYSAVVSGTDLIGNAYVSGTQSITFTVDSTAPTVAITSSDSDNTVKSADSNITVTATFNEAMATAPTITIGSSIDNVALTATSSTTWTYDWDISSVTEGSYTVTVTGTDPAGNTYAGNDSITLTVDNTAPTTTLSDTDADNILAVSDSVTITAFFNEGMTATPTISITGVVTNVTMSPQNGLVLEANSNFWNTGEPNNSGGEDVLELDRSKINDIPSSISQKSIIEFSDNRNSTISNFAYVGSYQGHSYYKSTNSSNWTTAKDNAITLGGNLVVINIQAELDYLNSVIDSNSENYHIGAYQDTGAVEPDGGWIWVSNKNNSYQYTFTVSNSLSSGTYYATVAGIDKASNAYSGTESITFTLDATLPTVTLTDNAADNIISTTFSPTNTVTITASFSEAMTATPSIYITGVVTNVAMTRVGSTNDYTYNWNTSTPTLAAGAYSVTVSGTDLIGNIYAGTDSITFTISPTFYLDANGVTVKCRGCSDGDTGYIGNVLYTAYDNTSLKAKSLSDSDWGGVVTSLVTDMSDLFYFNGSADSHLENFFNSNDISTWDTSKVTTFHGMFQHKNSPINSYGFDENLSYWDTSSARDMSYMFFSADNFNQNIGGWDTSNVENMDHMFFKARTFNNGSASGVSTNTLNWDTSNVTNMESMFADADGFNIDIGSWNTSSVENMQSMFNGTAVFNQDLNWEVSNVTTMTYMFINATSFNGNISSWEPDSVVSMNSMFYNAEDFNQDIGSWNMSSVTNVESMFRQAESFNQNIGSWDVSNITNFQFLFAEATAFNNGDASGVTSNTLNWDFSKATNITMSYMFYIAPAFNQDIGNWNTSNVRDMGSMFAGRYQARTSKFNQDIGSWNTSNVTGMQYMFDDAEEFNQDLSGWCVSSIYGVSPGGSYNFAARAYSWIGFKK